MAGNIIAAIITTQVRMKRPRPTDIAAMSPPIGDGPARMPSRMSGIATTLVTTHAAAARTSSAAASAHSTPLHARSEGTPRPAA